MSTTDGRAQRFANFLAGLSEADRDFFVQGASDRIVGEALELLPVLLRDARRKKDEKLFDSQIERLYKGCPAKGVQMLVDQKSDVLTRAEAIGEDVATYRRFLPVFPLAFLSVVSKMAMVGWNDQQGIIPTNFDPRIFMFMGYEEEAVWDPHYIFDIRFFALGDVDKKNFELLNIEEMIDFCVHTEPREMPSGLVELYALKPGNSEPGKEDFVASISLRGPRAKLDLVARRSTIPEDTLVLVRRKTEEEME